MVRVRVSAFTQVIALLFCRVLDEKLARANSISFSLARTQGVRDGSKQMDVVDVEHVWSALLSEYEEQFDVSFLNMKNTFLVRWFRRALGNCITASGIAKLILTPTLNKQ